MPTHLGGIPIGPGAFNESTTGMGIAGFGDGPLPAALPRGIFRGDQAQEFHEFSGVLKAGEVTEFGHGGDGHGELHATQGLQGFDDRM